MLINGAAHKHTQQSAKDASLIDPLHAKAILSHVFKRHCKSMLNGNAYVINRRQALSPLTAAQGASKLNFAVQLQERQFKNTRSFKD